MAVLKQSIKQHPKFSYKTPRKPATARPEVGAVEKPVTAHEFWLMQSQFKNERTRLIDGKVIRMAPASFEHGIQSMELGSVLRNHVKKHKLGIACGAETGFRLDAKNVLAPDVAFVAKERLLENQDLIGRNIRYDKFLPFAPNLAVEVVSPSERAGEIKSKVKTWLNFGVDAVWVVYPKSREVHVHARAMSTQVFTEADTLDGGDVLPGFTCKVKEIFADDVFGS